MQALDVDFDVLLNAPGDVDVDALARDRQLESRLCCTRKASTRTQYFIKPSIVLPEGWEYATALRDPVQSRHSRRLCGDAARIIWWIRRSISGAS